MQSVLSNFPSQRLGNQPKLMWYCNFDAGVTQGSWVKVLANNYQRTLSGLQDLTPFFGAGAVANIFALPNLDDVAEIDTALQATSMGANGGLRSGARELYITFNNVIDHTANSRPQGGMQIKRAGTATTDDIDECMFRSRFTLPANFSTALDPTKDDFFVLFDKKTGLYGGNASTGDYRLIVTVINFDAGVYTIRTRGDNSANGQSVIPSVADSNIGSGGYWVKDVIVPLVSGREYILEVYWKKPQKIWTRNPDPSAIISGMTGAPYLQDTTTGITITKLTDVVTKTEYLLCEKYGGQQTGNENLPDARFFCGLLYSGGGDGLPDPGMSIKITGIEYWSTKAAQIGKLEVGNFGPLPFVHTPLSRGTMFGASDGNDANPGTEASPKTYQGAINAATAPGSVVFFRGGTLALTTAAHFSLWNSGTAANPIIYEAYPGEVFTIDGSAITPGVGNQRRVNYSDSFQKLRGVRIINMPEYGIYNSGLDNMVDGCEVAYCSLSGISNTGSRFMIMNSWIHHCSDVGKFGGAYNNGGNADGISFSSGTGSSALHNLVTDCSDDAIDTWQSLYTTVEYNICIRSGAGDGNGNGIKAGGASVGAYSIVDHNLVWDCLNNGIDVNTGIGVSVNSNTTGSCGGAGYVFEADTTHSRNVSIGDGSTHTGTGIPGLPNSWDIAGTAVFLNTDETSTDFLKVTQDGTFDNIGAHYL